MCRGTCRDMDKLLYSPRIEVSNTEAFDIVATHNYNYDHLSYVEHVLGSIYVFFTLFGDGGLPMDWYTTCYCSFSFVSSCSCAPFLAVLATLYSSYIKVSEFFFIYLGHSE